MCETPLSLAVDTEPACSTASPSAPHSHTHCRPSAHSQAPRMNSLSAVGSRHQERLRGAAPDPLRKGDRAHTKTQSLKDPRAVVDRELVRWLLRLLILSRWARVS